MLGRRSVEAPSVDAPGLPQVLHDAPAAVLVIDLDRQQVVYANAAAIALTGEHVSLPVDVDTWSDAAGLTDLGGQRMSESTSPLSLVAAGVPVAGEPVAVHDAARRGSSLSPAQRQAGEGRLLWVTGFTLASAAESEPVFEGAGPQSRAMVVFQQLSGTELGDRRRLALLRDRAVIATEMSFTITDPRRPDHPLVWVNSSFTRLTGYRLEEVAGRNCRLLQGPNTDPDAVRRIGDALRRCEPITEVLLNYRRDGTAYWNQVSISPVTDGSGEVVNYVGVQNDVTERVMVEQERRAALAEAEQSRAQLRLLAEATTQMTGALDVADACARLARIVVPALADLCAVDLVDQPGSGPSRRIAVAARDAADEGLLRELGHAAGAAGDTGRVLDGGGPVLVAELPEHGAQRYPHDPAAAALFERLRLRSAMVVPVRARGRALGALTLLTQHPYGRRYGPRDVHLAADLAGRAGLTVDNARLYEVEHAAAVTLQRTLLPVVPEVEGLQVATRYQVGVDGNQVGGDWYDVLPLPDGAVGIAVGDVVGHDLRAAAAMGQLRGVVRSYAWDGGQPGSVLDRCDQLVQGLDMAAMATAVYARLEPPEPDGTRTLHYANAGHPTPLLLDPLGRLRRLDAHHSPMIGVLPVVGGAPGRGAASVQCPPGSLLLLYTDGLTDVAGEDADARTTALERAVAGVPPGADADTVVDGARRMPARAVTRRRGAARRAVDVLTSATGSDRSRITSVRSAYEEGIGPLPLRGMRLAVPTRRACVKGDEKMVAVSEPGHALRVDVPRPADGDAVEAGHRVVAVAVSPMELLRPGSDLLDVISSAGYVDLLLVCEDEPVPDPSPVGVLGGGELEPRDFDDDTDEFDDTDDVDEVRAAVAELGLDELHVHRLGLQLPLGTAADGDLVAALSELVGFDPEPGVQCLAPVPLPGDPARAAIERAVWRIAEVYSLPVQRYRCLELSVVDH